MVIESPRSPVIECQKLLVMEYARKMITHHECHKPADMYIIRVLPSALDEQSVRKLPVSGYIVFECLVVILQKRIVTKLMLLMILYL